MTTGEPTEPTESGTPGTPGTPDADGTDRHPAPLGRTLGPELVATLRKRLPRLLDDLGELVLVESPSSDQDAVRASAAVVARQGEAALGEPPEVVDVDGCRHLRWRLGDGPRRVLVLCHHDTVWPVGTLDRMPWSVTDGVARGPGCFDMLAGLVQGLHGLAVLRERGVSLDGVTVLVTGDEETGSPTSRALIEAEAAGCDAALVLEASADGGALKTGRKGASLYRVRVEGRAAHAGLEPERGVNATVELAHQVLTVAELGDAALGTSVTPTALTSGTTLNTVPAQGELSVDARALTVDEQQRVHTAMTALTPTVEGSQVQVTGGPNRPPLEPALTATLFAAAQTVAERLDLPALTGVTVGGASDGNFTAGVGVPTLDGLGAVGGGAHGDDEHVVVDTMPERAALLAGLVAHLLAESRDR
ncbi:M20 family metallopeptidase [Terracoccus luteus]|uniref:Glutamate carboxypeptidase n=1 Tax=Terracoccus luteus TaxID=53356 RepID=A0A839PU31_9MICO|nr:M20 family metallopeptidase [Terracoccus luteus]MBB2986689.1 glutamate carboxypeptidase [Terracoccus luteus]MCP2172340.1 glutamate carboxypeptidase [Terracoccus luteus]